MQHTTLGRTGLRVSRLCLGTMNFGPRTTEEDSFRIMDRALDEEIYFFDTADVYGEKKGEGVTEQIIGKWFAQGGGRRERTIIATKAYGGMNNDDNKNLTLMHGVNARKIKMEVEASLKRMQTDWIDLHQMHHIYRPMAWEECWTAYDTLIKQGKVLYAGSSNFAGWHVAAANETAKRMNVLGLVSEQSKYSLMSRAIETDVLPACEHYGVGVIPWSPLEGGLLGGVLDKQDTTGRRGNEGAQKRIEENRSALQKWEAFCKELGEKPANVALAWMLQDQRVTAPIIGPRTMDQLTGCLPAVDIKLDAEQMKQLDAIFPGPGGPAPESYAW